MRKDTIKQTDKTLRKLNIWVKEKEKHKIKFKERCQEQQAHFQSSCTYDIKVIIDQFKGPDMIGTIPQYCGPSFLCVYNNFNPFPSK